MTKQSYRQANNHYDPAVRAMTTQACARGERGPNSGPCRHPSLGKWNGTRHQPQRGLAPLLR
jgi:hypothetical protein